MDLRSAAIGMREINLLHFLQSDKITASALLSEWIKVSRFTGFEDLS